MKKMTAMLLTLALVLSMSLVPAAFAEAEPITIQFWHHRGSGTQYECVTHAVEGFNSTVGQELGIVVEESYIGDYVQLFSQIQLAVQSGEAPNVVSAANTYTAYMLEDGMLVDMAPLAEAEDYDITGNLMDWLLEIGGNTDGQIHSLPYCRSTPLFYYNKAVADELGIEIGDMITIDELVAFGEAAMQTDENGNVTRYGFEIFNDFGYYNAAWIYQLGSEYMAEGGGSPSLEDGTMLKVLTDWRDWVDAGWCRVFDATNAGDIAQTMLISGELASYMNSSAGLGNLMLAAEEAGVEVGVAMFPTYDPDNNVAEIGGANERELTALSRYGAALGLAFQVADDILDATSTTEEMGKTVGKDEKEGKLTYVALYGVDGARQRLDSLTEEAVREVQPVDADGFFSDLARDFAARKH